jgi:hypothetical protein
MPEFHYTSRKEMEPRPGVAYATVYYKQSLKEYTRLRAHIYRVAADIMAVSDSDSDYRLWLATPLKRFKKSVRGQYYTPMDIVTDMVEQFALQKDIPSGLLGRWTRLFEGTAWDICLVSGRPVIETTYGELFNYGQV